MSLAPRIDRLEKNYLINGGLDFFQRNTSAVNLTTTLSYINADRFRFSYTGTVTGTPQVQRSTDVPNYLTRYSQQFISRRNASTLSLNSSHRIEGANIRELAGSNFSVSFQVKSSVATVARLRVSVPSAEDNYTSVTEVYNSTKTIVADSSWGLVSFEGISAPITAINGIQIDISLEAASGTDASNTNHYICQLMFNGGNTAANFVRAARNLADELNMCQRYYEKTYNISTNPASAVNEGSFSYVIQTSQRGEVSFSFKVTKRIAPAITHYSTSGASGVFRDNSAGLDRSATVLDTGEGSNSSSLSASAPAGARYLFHWTAEAEL